MPTLLRTFQVVQGDSFTQGFTISGLDLTGWTVRGQVRTAPSNSTVAATFTTTIDDAVNGQFTARLAPSDTAALSSGVYSFDIEIFDAEDVFTLVRGELAIVAQVTR